MIVLTGLVFGVLAIGAYVSQLDNDWSSGRDVSLVADGERSVRGTGAVAGPGEGGAGVEAPRRRALRDDVAALRAQPNESIGAQAGDALAIAALQLAQQTNRSQQTNTAQQPAPKSNRMQAEAAAQTEHAQREHAQRGGVAPGEHARGTSGARTKPRSTHSAATTSGTGHARGGSHRSTSTAERSAKKKTASVAPGEWSFSRYAVQGVDSPPSAGPQAIASNAPKTRSEVRAELERARENGSLPAFGNPEPTGPAGTLRP
jgi:hypothetical protein